MLVSLASVSIAAVPARAARAPPFLCNLAKVVGSKGARRVVVRIKPRSRSAQVGTLSYGAPIYICDEQGDWYKVFYAGACGDEHPQGIKSDKVRSRKLGWLPRSRVKVISG